MQTDVLGFTVCLPGRPERYLNQTEINRSVFSEETQRLNPHRPSSSKELCRKWFRKPCCSAEKSSAGTVTSVRKTIPGTCWRSKRERALRLYPIRPGHFPGIGIFVSGISVPGTGTAGKSGKTDAESLSETAGIRTGR